DVFQQETSNVIYNSEITAISNDNPSSIVHGSDRQPTDEQISVSTIFSKSKPWLPTNCKKLQHAFPISHDSSTTTFVTATHHALFFKASILPHRQRGEISTA
ncbi:hypothetical protein ACLOJK_015284, partial [Asimina triloba]